MFFIIIERLWKSSARFVQKTWKICAAASEHIFMLKIVGLLLKKKCAADIFICVAASRNISIFFNERAAAFGKILTKMCDYLWKKMCSWFLELCPLKKCFEVKTD